MAGDLRIGGVTVRCSSGVVTALTTKSAKKARRKEQRKRRNLQNQCKEEGSDTERGIDPALDVYFENLLADDEEGSIEDNDSQLDAQIHAVLQGLETAELGAGPRVEDMGLADAELVSSDDSSLASSEDDSGSQGRGVGHVMDLFTRQLQLGAQGPPLSDPRELAAQEQFQPEALQDEEVLGSSGREQSNCNEHSWNSKQQKVLHQVACRRLQLAHKVNLQLQRFISRAAVTDTETVGPVMKQDRSTVCKLASYYGLKLAPVPGLKGEGSGKRSSQYLVATATRKTKLPKKRVKKKLTELLKDLEELAIAPGAAVPSKNKRRSSGFGAQTSDRVLRSSGAVAEVPSPLSTPEKAKRQRRAREEGFYSSLDNRSMAAPSRKFSKPMQFVPSGRLNEAEPTSVVLMASAIDRLLRTAQVRPDGTDASMLNSQGSELPAARVMGSAAQLHRDVEQPQPALGFMEQPSFPADQPVPIPVVMPEFRSRSAMPTLTTDSVVPSIGAPMDDHALPGPPTFANQLIRSWKQDLEYPERESPGLEQPWSPTATTIQQFRSEENSFTARSAAAVTQSASWRVPDQIIFDPVFRMGLGMHTPEVESMEGLPNAGLGFQLPESLHYASDRQIPKPAEMGEKPRGAPLYIPFEEEPSDPPLDESELQEHCEPSVLKTRAQWKAACKKLEKEQRRAARRATGLPAAPDPAAPPATTALNFGEFEKYTRGVGSRLLAQMGYGGQGTGLGRENQGIPEPVKAFVRPKKLGLGA